MGIGVAIAGAWSAIGAASIGAIAIGGLLQGAIIGAAIGGLTTAFTGGSIGKGMLFGAIGGAVTGGLTSYVGGFGGAGFTSAVPTGWGGASIANTVTSSSVLTAGNSLGGAATVGAGTSVALALGDIGKDVLAQGIVAGVAGYMDSEKQDDILDAQKKESALNRQHDFDKMNLAAKLAGEAGGGGGGGGGGVDNTGAELAYKARMAELDQRKSEFNSTTAQTRKEWDTEMERRSQRRGLFSGANRSSSEAIAPTGSTSSVLEKRQGNEILPAETALTPAPAVVPEEKV